MARYQEYRNKETGEVDFILDKEKGFTIPKNVGNAHYQEFLIWAETNIIDPDPDYDPQGHEKDIEFDFINSELKKADQEILALEDSLTPRPSVIADWRTYRRELRALHLHPAFPNPSIRPTAPTETEPPG